MKSEINQINLLESKVITVNLQKILAANIDGDVVEFGCYAGATSIVLAKILDGTNKRLYVYDSFEGLPEKAGHDISPIGQQFKFGELFVSKNQLIKNIKKSGVKMPIIKKSWFNQLTSDDIPTKICFAFLDGDYYQSIKDSFILIENNLSAGSVIIVDDYSNESLPGAKKAVDEWLFKNPHKLRIEQSLAIIYL